jgi:Lrp/AsnC family transcriptional regulator for asnA, asnC and gidA
MVERNGGYHMAHKIDRTDQGIVEALLEDGRMSSADISRRLGNVSERAVRYRIKRLIATGIIDVKAIVNPRALGLAVNADIFLEVEPSLVREVAESMARLEQVSYVAFSTGARDLSIQVYARDNEQLHQFVTEVVSQVPGVRRASTMVVPRVVKDVYNWRIPESCYSNGGGAEG